MRTLLIFRGAPGCGKSTFIKDHNLQNYTLSPDDIRQQLQGYVLLPDGSFGISQKNEKKVWEILFDCLERRMQNGSFTVIDATSSKATEMNKYKKLADDYKYRIFCIDMTDVPIEECKRRNSERFPLAKRVPDEAIDKMYARFATQKIPSGIKVIKPEELDSIWIKEFDLSEYKSVHVIGDIHGCYTALMNYFDAIYDDHFYIFVGDYLDRGIENVQVYKFIEENIGRKNFLFLEGNHERHIKDFGENRKSRSKVFNKVTEPELVEAGISRISARKMYHRFGQVAWFKHNNNHFLVTHGGLSRYPWAGGMELTGLCTDQFIAGVGAYGDMELCAESFSKDAELHKLAEPGENFFQVFGHRNIMDAPLIVDNHNFCLEGHVERGGELRCIEIRKNMILQTIVENDVWRPLPDMDDDEPKETVPTKSAETVEDFVSWARKNRRTVDEKKFEFGDGHVSSFNFSRSAFQKGIWNGITTRARGLFIDTDKMEVFARSYEKFFKTDEVDETKVEALKDKVKFPVTCYKKYNGYLLLAAYNPYLDDIFVASKSTIEGSFAENGREELKKELGNGWEYFKNYLKHQNVTAVFENVDFERDPHVVEPEQSGLILLDLVCNDLEFKKKSYESLFELASILGIKCKVRLAIFRNWREYYEFYDAEKKKEIPYEPTPISEQYEGYVLEDAAGFMWKLKSNYYNFWKSMRWVLGQCIKKGYIDKTSGLTTPLANDFYAFCKHYHDDPENAPRDIITARNEFYKNKEIAND